MQYFIFGLLVVALVVMQLLRGGWILASSLPAYAFVACGAMVSWFPFSKIHLPEKCRWPLLSAVVFFGYLGVRTLLSPVDFIARPDLFAILGSAVVYLLFAFYVTSPRLRVWLVAVLLLLGCANGLVGAIQYFKGENFMIFTDLPRADYGKRASGFFGNPNQLAGFLELALLLGIGVAWWGRWKLWGRLVAGYGALMCAAALLLTGSRGGYASTLAGLFVFVLLCFMARERRSHGNVWAIVFAVVVLTATLAFTAYAIVQGSDLLRSRVEGATADVPFRASLWKAALQQFTLSPIFGTGSATYVYYGRMFRGAVVQTDPIYSHNDYVQLLAEFGLVGFACFLFMLTTHLRAGWRSIGELSAHLRGSRLAAGSNSLALTIGALSCVAAYVIHSMVDFNLHIPANALLMAIVFGLLANPGSIPASSKTGEHEPVFTLPTAARLIAPALGAWMLFSGLNFGYGAYYSYRAERILSDWKFLDKKEIAQDAEKLARLGLERDPKNLDLYRSLGDALFALAAHSTHLPEARMRYLQESVEVYKRALELAPMDRNLLLGLCWTYDDMRLFSESAPLYQRALEIDPNSGQVRAAYAGHLEMQGRLEDAKKAYQLAVERGSLPAHLALERLSKERKIQRTGSENDAPKLGR